MESSNMEHKITDQDPNQPRKQKRRTRNDPNNRNFACGCGKAYLSYPALYTHLKQKHDGKAPEGTNLPQSSSKGIRGRPKKEENNPNQEKEEEMEGDISDTSLDEENSLNEFLYYLANLSKTISHDPEKSKHLVLETETEGVNVIENFPQEFFGEKQDYLGILIYLKEIVNNNGEFIEETNEENQLKKTVCDRVFAIFLYKISKHVSPDCFKELCVFICLFRKTLNMLGWNMIRMQQSGNNVSKIEIPETIIPFCENNTAEFALEISNDFIIDFFPKFLKDVKFNDFVVLGEDEDKLKNVVYLTQHFCNWLFNNYYTNSRLSLNLSPIEKN